MARTQEVPKEPLQRRASDSLKHSGDHIESSNYDKQSLRSKTSSWQPHSASTLELCVYRSDCHAAAKTQARSGQIARQGTVGHIGPTQVSRMESVTLARPFCQAPPRCAPGMGPCGAHSFTNAQHPVQRYERSTSQALRSTQPLAEGDRTSGSFAHGSCQDRLDPTFCYAVHDAHRRRVRLQSNSTSCGSQICSQCNATLVGPQSNRREER